MIPIPLLAKFGPLIAKVAVALVFLAAVFFAGAWWKESNMHEARLEAIERSVRDFQTRATRQAMAREREAQTIATERRKADAKFRKVLSENSALKAELDRFLTVDELDFIGVCHDLPDCRAVFGRFDPAAGPAPESGGVQEGYYWPRLRAALEVLRDLDDRIRADNQRKQQLREQLQ